MVCLLFIYLPSQEQNDADCHISQSVPALCYPVYNEVNWRYIPSFSSRNDGGIFITTSHQQISYHSELCDGKGTRELAAPLYLLTVAPYLLA